MFSLICQLKLQKRNACYKYIIKYKATVQPMLPFNLFKRSNYVYFFKITLDLLLLFLQLLNTGINYLEQKSSTLLAQKVVM